MDDTDAFDRALAAALTGQGGLCVVSAPGSGKSALLTRAMAALPGMGIAVARVGADANPRDLEALMRPAAGEPGGRRLILIEEAHRLSIPALRALDGLVSGARLAAGGVGLLLAGTPDLLQRLVAARATRLLHYPAFTLDPLSDAVLPAPPGQQDRAGRSIDRLPQAVLATAAVVIAGSIAVFILAPHGADRPEAAPPEPASSAVPAGPVVQALDPPVPLPSPVEMGPPSPLPEPGNDQVGATLGGPGLLLVAREGDTLQRMYRSIYEGSTPPPFRDVEKANPHPIRPGVVVVFPTPPDGWRKP